MMCSKCTRALTFESLRGEVLKAGTVLHEPHSDGFSFRSTLGVMLSGVS